MIRWLISILLRRPRRWDDCTTRQRHFLLALQAGQKRSALK